MFDATNVKVKIIFPVWVLIKILEAAIETAKYDHLIVPLILRVWVFLAL